jgi:hypothetical protein
MRQPFYTEQALGQFMHVSGSDMVDRQESRNIHSQYTLESLTCR